MYDKAIKDMEARTGIYDMVYIEQDIIYAYLARNFLVDVTKSLKDDPSLKAPDFDESHFTTFANYFKNADGDLFGVPMEAFIKIYLYRTDLFNDPEIQAAFKAKTGKDLKPATTHEDYTADRRVLHRVRQGEGPRPLGHHRPGVTPATRPPGTSSSSRSRRPSASTTGASTPPTTTAPPSSTAAR